ncbi:MAG: ParA family protein, partial [Halanaeroarchaeum sp.]
MHVRTAALVGAAGGAGTTRTAVELAGALARAERSVLVFDLDFATQGLSQSVAGRIDPDVTAVLTDDVPVADAALSWDVPGDGRLDVLPAFAPFVEVAAAMTPDVAASVGDVLREATATYDHVLLDVPPIVSNPA